MVAPLIVSIVPSKTVPNTEPMSINILGKIYRSSYGGVIYRGE